MTEKIFPATIHVEKSNVNSLLIFLVIFGMIIAIFGNEFFPSLISLLVLIFLIKLFYKPGLSMVIFAGLLFNWLQISIKVWYANFTGISLNEVFAFYNSPDKMHEAFYLSSIGLIALSSGIYLIYKKFDANHYFNKLMDDFEKYDAKRILIGYLIITITLGLLFSFRLALPGINTIVVAIGKLKWGFFLLFFLVVVIRKKYTFSFIVIILFETIVSLSGYFSGFKDFLIYLFIGIISFTSLITLRRLMFIIPGIFIVFQLGIIWTAVKGDYRDFLSGYSRQQVVVVSQQEALAMLFYLVSNIDGKQYESAIDELVDRIGFTDFFSLTLNYVPEYQQHENGRIWEEALTFYFKPRMFYPDKRVIDDSEHTSKYTGLMLANAAKGASHSIGFMTDSYIDYGKVFMHVPIFFFGIVIGILFKYFLLKSMNAVWGLIFTAPFYLLTSFYSFNLIKVIGNLLIYVVVVFLIGKYIVKIVDPFLRKDKIAIRHPQKPIEQKTQHLPVEI